MALSGPPERPFSLGNSLGNQSNPRGRVGKRVFGPYFLGLAGLLLARSGDPLGSILRDSQRSFPWLPPGMTTGDPLWAPVGIEITVLPPEITLGGPIPHFSALIEWKLNQVLAHVNQLLLLIFVFMRTPIVFL